MRCPLVNAGNAYARDVVAGKIDVCEYIRLACQRHLDDLKRYGTRRTKKPYWFDREAAEKAMAWMSRLPHTKGKWARDRELLELAPWQCFLYLNIFGWKRREGTRRFREAYCEIPRKNGKSVTAAALGLRFFSNDNEFGAEVYSGATSEKQAWEVFRPARLMVARTPSMQQALGIEVNAQNLYRPADGSRFEPLIGKPGDGASPSCAIADEFHEHDTPVLVDTMETGMGAREQPLLFQITTAGSNLAGPCYQKRDYAIKVLQGTFENEALFVLIYTVDKDDDWTTEAALKKANPNYGVSVDADFLKAQQRAAMQVASKQGPFLTKHLNIWVGARHAWMNMQAWRKAPPRLGLDELAGRPCYVGLDLATKIDVAALLLLFPPDGDDPLWHCHGRYYLPEERVEEGATTNASHYYGWSKEGLITLTDGNVIDFDRIGEDLRDYMSRLDIREIAFDPWQATHFCSQMLEEGLPMVEVRMTARNLSEPMKQVEALALEKKLAHGNCPVLNWMVSNVTAKVDANENIFPRKETDDSKIDGAVALILAMNRALMSTEDYADGRLVVI